MYVNKFNCQNVYAGNEEHRSITGWVNIKKDAQEHIKRISHWHWQGFATVIEKAAVGEFYTKVNDNRAATLDIEDYTDSMKKLHKILTQSLLYSVQRKKALPPFTVEYLKDGLRNSWTAEMIGHLIIKYESEWYADEALTKWNEIDNLIEEEKQKQKNLIEKQLDENNITMPYKRDYALSMVDDVHEKTNSIWQLEKEQRIKPSLWWREVAQSQPTPQTPALSNLSADGKAWFIHPIMLINYFKIKTSPWHEPLKNPQRTRYNNHKNRRAWNGAFGLVRNEGNRAHAGLDIFARLETPCYACLDGKIVQDKSESGYGNVIVLKVKGDDLRASRNNYTLEFSGKDKNEIVQADNFDIDSDYFYIRYCHLHDTKKVPGIKVGCKVKAGDHIGYTSDTGNAKDLPNTHLHLEIAMKIRNNKTENETNKEIRKLGYKINPAFFVNLNPIDETDQKDAVIKGNKFYKQN